MPKIMNMHLRQTRYSVNIYLNKRLPLLSNSKAFLQHQYFSGSSMDYGSIINNKVNLNMSEEMRRMVSPELYLTHYNQITFRTSFGNCVLTALQNRQWKQVDAPGWHLNWSQKERVNDVFEQGLNNNQRCNHFRLWGQLCRKDMLIKNIRKHKRYLQKQKNLVEEDWNFLPMTFFLPSEYIMFAEQFKKKGGLWIMKPTSRCQGKGIFIIDKLSEVAPFRHKLQPQPQPQSAIPPKPTKAKKQQIKHPLSQNSDNSDSDKEEKEDGQAEGSPESYIIQQYISRPLLFGSKKFDLRIYCLCTNYSQLTAWLYRSGFARFTHQPYSPDNIGNLESHLTNVEIQKHSENYDQVRGGKWLLGNFKHYLLSKYSPARVDWCFTEIQNIILRSLQAVQKNVLASKNSFQLYGYDFMMDETLKPWLIEVNGGPSMTANTPFDEKLKCGLVDDVLTIVDFQGILQGNQMTVGGFDLISDKGVKVAQPKMSDYSGLLGAKNQRRQVTRHLVRKFLKRKEKENGPPEQEKITKKKGKVEGGGRQKLLPDFYYRRKHEGIDSDARTSLKFELKDLLNSGQGEDEDFTPLRGQ